MENIAVRKKELLQRKTPVLICRSINKKKLTLTSHPVRLTLEIPQLNYVV